jgi:hypothetical protein
MADTILNGRGQYGTRGGAARYSLADYYLIIKFPNALASRISGNQNFGSSTDVTYDSLIEQENNLSTNITSELSSSDTTMTKDNYLIIGGTDSYVGSIEFKYKEQQWEVTGDPTGSWVHSKNRNRTGTCSLSMQQVAYKTAFLIKIFNIYFNDINSDNEDCILDGMDLYIVDRKGRKLMSADDCYIASVPQMAFGEKPKELSWEFNCGRIIYEDTI